MKAPKQIHDPKSVTPEQRVKEFPSECFTVSGKRLFCTVCQQEVALKRSIITSHVGSSKHTCSKERHERDIASSLVVYDAQTCTRGETLQDAHRIYCVKAAMTFLRATKVSAFAPF